jgi:hypothetical protein
VLGREFLADPQCHMSPAPIRIGHLLAAALALRVSRSFQALSTLSLICHGLLCVATFVCVKRPYRTSRLCGERAPARQLARNNLAWAGAEIERSRR